VNRAICQWLDRLAINAAARAVGKGGEIDTARNLEAARLFPELFSNFRTDGPVVSLNGHHFQFASLAPVGVVCNDLVHGEFFAPRAPATSAVLLVHGWDAELHYRYFLPRVARRLNGAGLAVAMVELPFHMNRRPRISGVPHDFISSDLLTMLRATRQAIQDLLSTAIWLRSRGIGQITIWGYSLGAWLAGLLCCFTSTLEQAVLITPIVDMERAIAELAFCAPVRAALQETPMPLTALNLTSYSPSIAPSEILVVESRFDLFAGAEPLNVLLEKWHRPRRWTVDHGHISVLLSRKVTEGTIEWISARSKG
jgi:pimeloyl-ACP methyl ester carboxylesterase